MDDKRELDLELLRKRLRYFVAVKKKELAQKDK
jgi:hypothetical protein